MDRTKLGGLLNLNGRTALVAGGTRGIGLNIAETYTLSSSNVVVASRKPAASAAATEHLTTLGGHAIGVPTHAVDLDALSVLVDATRRRGRAVAQIVSGFSLQAPKTSSMRGISMSIAAGTGRCSDNFSTPILSL
ncbi:SDR family NAD(P)-dependent oxidoreductase [Rhodococcus sp. IEGM 1366]|uniref:SDR family NAD(P)-dependent oxidoreductase n=1 Tax=Rhodococcus sp. IEGM 1366 TaxID=3082223 RepID=UPI002952A7E6|nr:SDR family NAD(P)-dependent oxidoreductase [Rhodococcus sp. IEGM 1366]MDV8071375.1 SDR family NAD(P)-dependent oxidoreductase [Rhodococcus sp. IEGM 1366]